MAGATCRMGRAEARVWPASPDGIIHQIIAQSLRGTDTRQFSPNKALFYALLNFA